MATFHVYIPTSSQYNYFINTSLPLPAERLAERVFQVYLGFYAQITQTHLKLNALCSRMLQEDPTSIDLLTPVKELKRIPLSLDQMRSVFKIVTFLNFIIPPEQVLRFKIYQLCSVTILKGWQHPTFAVHFKKKEISPSLGVGLASKVNKALFFNGAQFSIKAEKTTYRFYFPPIFTRDLPVEDGSLFINDPQFFYPYVSFIKNDGFSFLKRKWCQLLDLYDISLCEYLDLNKTHFFLKPQTVLKIALFLSQTVKALHDKNWIQRDIKPDNILIKFNTSGTEIDLNEISLVATDLETFCEEGAGSLMWVGTPYYHPVNKLTQRQDRSADIFALGKSFATLFDGFSPSQERVNLFLLRMQSETPSERPNIDEVIALLKQVHDDYLLSLQGGEIE